MSIDLTALNDAQRIAVLHTDGPYLINAGPGAGKTQVLTHRIAYIIEEKGVPPHRIMALTFTNKAASQMRTRIQKLIGQDAQHLWMGTFHSLFARLLRIEAQALGLPRDFSIYDRTDSIALIKILIKELGLDDEIYKPNVVLNRISGAKNRLMNAQTYAQDAACKDADIAAAKPRMAELFSQYQARCKQAGALDFDDLLLTTYHLFTQHPDLAQKYQQRFQYLLVDEFQDTNKTQYAILKILAAQHQNLCVIGDDAQSIYAFRGADIKNILSFKKDFPQMKMTKLEQNYRSTKHIVQAANSLIGHNRRQLKKEVFTANPAGPLLSLIQTTSELEEASFVARSIFEQSHSQQLTYDNFAILYRTNNQSRVIEEALRKNNIPYQIIGSTSFYQRKEVKDVLAYLRLLVNTNDEQALRRVINLPKRGIGPSTLEKVWIWAHANKLSVWEVLSQIKNFMKGGVALAIADFVQLITEYRQQLGEKDAYTLAMEIAKRSGLLTTLSQNKTLEGVSRYENVQELLNAIKTFSTHAKEQKNRLADFLQEVALVSTVDKEDEDTMPKVVLMTIHSAKGLEFPYVYIVGMEEGLFPSLLATHEQADVEEERRLFYVALTRSKTKIYLTCAQTRWRFGKQKSCRPSRFLNEIDATCLQVTHTHPHRTPPPRRLSNKQPVAVPERKNYRPIQGVAKNKFSVANISKLVVDKRVKHPTFGIGRVVTIDTGGTHKKITINFGSKGQKILLLGFAKLQLL